MQGLLDDLMAEIDLADHTLLQMQPSSLPPPPPLQETPLLQVNKPMKEEPKFSFGKSRRFPEEKVQPQSLEDSFLSTASASTSASLRSTATAFQFGKKERFVEQVTQEQSMLNPNYEVSKAQPRGFRIHKDVVGKKEGEKDYLGPGTYSLNYKQVEGKAQVAIGKGKRFRREEVVEQQMLKVNYGQVERRVNGVLIRENLEKNEKLLRKQQLEVVAEEGRARRERERGEDKYRQLDRHVGTVKMEKFPFFNWQQELRQRRQATREARLGPGCYQWDRPQKAVCLVVYRSCSPQVVTLPQRRPSPTRYFAGEEGHTPKPQAHTFAKEPRQKEQPADRRKALDVQYKQIDKEVAQVHMSGNGRKEEEETLEEVKRGPGKYHPDYGQVLPRTDRALRVAKGDREKEIEDHLVNKDIFQGYLDINWATQTRNQLVFAYHQLTEWGPTYVPQSALHPEKWRFYDLPAEEGKGALIAEGKDKEAFLEYQQNYQDFMAYLARKRRTPEQYEVSYAQIDKHVPVVEIREHIQDQVVIQEQEELILEPNQRGGEKHLPNIQWDKQPPRWAISPEKETVLDERELVEPKRDKIKGMVEMDKQLVERGEKTREVSDALNEIDYTQVEQKVKGQVRMDKQVRPQEPSIPAEQVELPVDLVPYKIKQTVNMKGGAVRFKSGPVPQPLPPGVQETNQRIQIDKSKQAVRPKERSALWTKDTGRNDRHVLNKQIQARLAKKQALLKQKEKEEQLEKGRRRAHEKVQREQRKGEPEEKESLGGWQVNTS